MWNTRLVAYTLGTDDRIGLLPDALSFEASLARNDAGALHVSYSMLTASAKALDRPLADGLDLAVEVNWGAGWVEPSGGRYVLTRQQLDAADRSRSRSLTLPSYGWLLGKSGVNAMDKLDSDGSTRTFEPGNPGLLRILLDEWAGRHPGKMLRLAWNFTETVDSAGEPWARTMGAIPFAAHRPLREVLASLASMDGGLCDWETVGRTLCLYNPDSQIADVSGVVRLELGLDVGDAPSEETLEDAAGWILVRGDDNLVAVYAPSDAPAQIEAWETVLQASGVTTEEEALAAAAGDLEYRGRPLGQYTRQLLFGDKVRWLPIRDYTPGDVVSAWAVDGRRAMRVQQITLTRDSQGVHSGSVILNDRLVPAALRQARTLRALAANAAITGAGGPVSATDERTPKAPTGVTLSDQRYLDIGGVWRSRIGAAWLPVTEATNGTALSPVRYELWGKMDAPSPADWRQLTTVDAPELAASWEPFGVGQTWLFAVTAVAANGRVSARSAPVEWTFTEDTTPPPPPSAPAVSVWVGTAMVGWDGLDDTGVAMPADFARVEAHVSTDPDFVPDTSVDSTTRQGPALVRSGALALTGLAYGTPYWVRLVGVDTSGNVSTPSTAVEFVPTQLVEGDLGDEVVTARALRAGAVQANHLEAALALVGRLIAGPDAGPQAVLSPNGLDYRTGGGDDPRLSLGPDGLQIFGDLGALMTHLAPERSIFRGDAELNNVDVHGTARLLSDRNEIGPGGKLMLTTGIRPPGIAPTPANWYQTITLKNSHWLSMTGVQWVGRLSDGKFVATRRNAAKYYVISVHDADGTWLREHIIDIWPPNVYTTYPTVVNDHVVFINRYPFTRERFSLEAYNVDTWVRTSNTGTTYHWSTYNNNANGLTWSGGTKALMEPDEWNGVFNHPLVEIGFTWTGDNFTNTFTKLADWSYIGTQGARSTFDFGTDIALSWDGATTKALAIPSLAPQTNLDFPSPATGTCTGIGFTSGVIWMSFGSTIYYLDGSTWTGATTRALTVGITFYDSIGDPHETTLSPTATLTQAKRARLRVTGPQLTTPSGVDDIDGIRVYAGTAPATLYRQGNTVGGNSVFNAQTVALSGVVYGPGTIAPAFPDATPAEILSTDGSVIIKGDGTGKIPANMLTGQVPWARLPIQRLLYDFTGVTIAAGGSYTIPAADIPTTVDRVISIVPYSNSVHAPIVGPCGYSSAGVFIRNVSNASFTFHATNARLNIYYYVA